MHGTAIAVVCILVLAWFVYQVRARLAAPLAHLRNYRFTPNYWIGGSRISRNIGSPEQGARDCDNTPGCVGFDWDGEASALRTSVPAALWPNTRTDLAPNDALGAYVRI